MQGKNAINTGVGDPTASYSDGNQPNMKRWKMAGVAKHVDGNETVFWDGGVWMVQPFALCSIPENAAKHYFEGHENYSIFPHEDIMKYATKAVELLELSKRSKNNSIRKTAYQLFMMEETKKKESVKKAEVRLVGKEKEKE